MLRAPPNYRAFAPSSSGPAKKRTLLAVLLSRPPSISYRIELHGTTMPPSRSRVLTMLRFLPTHSTRRNFLPRARAQTRSAHSMRIAPPPSPPPTLFASRPRRMPATAILIRTHIVSRTSRPGLLNTSPASSATANAPRFDHTGLRTRPRRRERPRPLALHLRSDGCSRSSANGDGRRSKKRTRPSSLFLLSDASMHALEPLTWSIGLALLLADGVRASRASTIESGRPVDRLSSPATQPCDTRCRALNTRRGKLCCACVRLRVTSAGGYLLGD